MTTFWDTSAAINAAVSETVNARLDAGEHFARLHLLAEFFSTMTGRGVEVKDATGQPVRVLFSVPECVQWLRDFAGKVQFVELDTREVLDALDKADGHSVKGARVYDYWHALSARKARADVLVTRNTTHFAGLTGSARVEWP